MRIQFVQDLIDILRGKENNTLPYEKRHILPITTRAIDKSKQIVAVDGFYFSGSTAVTDILSEFDISKSYAQLEEDTGILIKKHRVNCEVTFFTEKWSLFNLIDAYRNRTCRQQDLAIKQFIYMIYKFYEENKALGSIYSENFIDLSIKFLENVIDINEETKINMKGKKYPYRYTLFENDGKHYSFIQEHGNLSYVLYRFKKMKDEEFDIFVADYLYDFFNNLGNDKMIILDQLFSLNLDLQEKMNFYMNQHPVKEICVYRDPRDQYYFAFRDDFNGYLAQTAEQHLYFYKKTCIKKINTVNPNRLSLKFEDLIFDYENSLQKIYDFLDLDSSHHIYKKQIFNPEISKKNVGVYKLFYDQDFMKKVGDELSEYCYE